MKDHQLGYTEPDSLPGLVPRWTFWRGDKFLKGAENIGRAPEISAFEQDQHLNPDGSFTMTPRQAKDMHDVMQELADKAQASARRARLTEREENMRKAQDFEARRLQAMRDRAEHEGRKDYALHSRQANQLALYAEMSKLAQEVKDRHANRGLSIAEIQRASFLAEQRGQQLSGVSVAPAPDAGTLTFGAQAIGAAVLGAIPNGPSFWAKDGH